MAGILGELSCGDVALTANTAKTIMQLTAAANHRVKIRGFGVFFDGTSGTAEPVTVQLIRQTDAGTATSLSPVKDNSSDSETIQTTASYNATVEPTSTDILLQVTVHPQSGYQVYQPYGQEFIVPGGTRVGIKCLSTSAVNATAVVSFEE